MTLAYRPAPAAQGVPPSPAPLRPADALAARLPAARRADAAETHALLARHAPRAARGTWILAFLNAHGFNLCAESPAAARAFAGADLVLRDGVGMATLLRWAGRDPGVNANGTDLIPRLALAPGARVALYGGRPGVAETAAAAITARGGRVVAARHGFHPLDSYERWIAEDSAAGADLVILGLGSPRQEALAERLRAAAPVRPGRPLGIVCGGAILDFLSGRMPRAPRWMRRAGLEWAWRLGIEPGRLFRRYVIGNPLFLLRAAGAARRLRAVDARAAHPPAALAAEPGRGRLRHSPARAA